MKKQHRLSTLFTAVFGRASWNPPNWLKWGARQGVKLAGGCRRHPKASILSILIVAGLSVGGLQWWHWWQSHKPRDFSHNALRQVEVAISIPQGVVKPGAADQNLKPAPLRIAFSGAPVAPLEQIGKEAKGAVSMLPNLPGKWTWADGSTLLFQPKTHWAPGTEIEATLKPQAMAADIELDTTQLSLTTPPLVAEIHDFSFYNSPKDPSVYQVVGELRLSHPVELKQLQSELKLGVIGGTRLFTKGSPLFTVKPDPESARRFFIRSRQIVIPKKEDYVKLTAPEGLVSSFGGAPLAKAASAKTHVPDKHTGLKIERIETRIIRTNEGEPQQFLFVHTNRLVDSAEIAERIDMWWSQQRWKVGENLLEERIDKATAIKLQAVEAPQAVSKQHSFRFIEPRSHGQLLVRIGKGVVSPGGFETPDSYVRTASVPPYPKETRLLGEGHIIALDGERKLVVQSRGIDHLRLTLSRVPASELNHLVSLYGRSSIRKPQLQGDFSPLNMAQSWSKVITVQKINEWQASRSTIDLSEAPPLQGADAAPGGRGIFFITVEPVSRISLSQPKDDVYSRIESPGYQQVGGIPNRFWYRSGHHQPKDGWRRSSGTSSERFAMVTDLGLLVKAAADDSRDVFVMSLDEGKPVRGVTIRTLARNGTTLEETTTDRQGHARLASYEQLDGENQAVAVVASKGDDLSFLPLNERQLPAMDYSRHDIDGVVASQIKAVEAFVFTERGIYRPGDTVHTGVVVRRRDWQAVLEGLPIAIRLQDSRGRQLAAETTRLPYDGYVASNLTLPETASLGTYHVEVCVLNSSGRTMFQLGRSLLRVEEFEPERMKVTTQLDPSPPAGWMDGSRRTAKASVRSLFGEAAPERLVSMKLTLSHANFRFPQWPGYHFHDPGTANSNSRAGTEIELGEKKSDEEGLAEFELPLDTLKDASYRLTLHTEAYERAGGRSVKHALTCMVSPHDSVIGWKADGNLNAITKDAGISLKLVAIDRQLKPVALDNLRRRIIQIRQVSALTKLSNGNYAYVSTAKERKVHEEPYQLAADATEQQLPSGEVGRFRMEIVDTDGLVHCAVPFRVVGQGDPDPELEREAELQLQLSHNEVIPGQEIEVYLTAPYAGAGLVSIERETVHAYEWFQTDSKATTVRIRIPEDAEGTYYINAAFVRATSSPEVFHSPLSYAAAPVRVINRQRQLELNLDAPKEVRPGTQATFRVRSDRPARVLVYAVDEGIHRITNYQRPKPLAYFTRKQALEVRTQQWLDLLMPEYRFLKAAAAFGGDGMGEDMPSMHVNPFKRRKEAPVVFWSGMVGTGPEGREVSWMVPDYFNGNLRVMAVACRADAMASAEVQTLVKAPIILQPNAPLFVTPDDEFEVSLTVFNDLETAGSTPIQIRMNLDDSLKAIGESVQSLTLEQGAEGVLRFRLKAMAQLGNADLRFVATGGGETIGRSTSLSVRPATHHRTQVLTGWFRTGSVEKEVSRDLHQAFRHTEATLSTTPLGLAKGLESYVSEYPYGCTEQITSKAMVKLIASTEVDFGIPPQEASDAIDHAIALLTNRQRSDGGFGYWSADGANPLEFHSLYALHFLSAAKASGHPVPQRMFSKALRYTRDCARAKTQQLGDARLQAYAIYLLALNGQTPSPQLLNLRDTLQTQYEGKWEHQSTAAWMAASYRMLKQEKEAKAVLERCLKARANLKPGKPNWSYHQSPQIEATQVFLVQCLHFPEQAKEFGIEDLEPVMKPLRDQSFNTLACSYMTLALKAYSDLAADTGLTVEIHRLAKGLAESERVAGPSTGMVRAAFDADTTALRFERSQQGDGDLGAFYQIVEQGYDRGTPKGPLRSGLEVSRLISKPKDGQPLHPGDALEVVLRVRNVSGRDLSNLAVIDLLPAGFEVLRGDLRSGARTVAGSSFAELREDRNLFFIDLEANGEWSVSYRMKAICAGSFQVPTAMAEDMYDPGLHGVSTPGRIEVAPTP